MLRSQYPGWASTYERVSQSATPNYRGPRIPVESKLNIPAWRERAHLISDGSLIDMLQYGFPVGFESVKVVDKNARDQCIREVVCSVGGGESKEMGAQAGVEV